MTDGAQHGVSMRRAQFAVTATSGVPDGIDRQLWRCEVGHVIRAERDPVVCPVDDCGEETRQAPRSIAARYTKGTT